MNQYLKQLKKKWGTLLLLFLFPFIVISLVLGMIVSVLLPSEESPISVVLVDEDLTDETMIFRNLFEGISSEQQFIRIISLPKEQAQNQMEKNEISAYFIFPKGFTDDLYNGNSVTMPIVGNPSKPIDSYLVNELLTSMTRYIGAAQANILTINDYAKELEMPSSERQELMLSQFIDFAIYTLGKDNVLDEVVVTNISTSSPVHYYVLAGWFLSLTTWLLGFYMILGREEHESMRIRMSLFGVTKWQRTVARLIVSVGLSIGLAAFTFLIIEQFVHFKLYALDYFRFGLFTLLYSILLVVGIAFIDVWIFSRKSVLLLQSTFVFVMAVTSGAFIPTLYLPQIVQGVLPYFFSYESMNWMIDIVLEDRNYANFTNLVVAASIGLGILWLSSVLKERWSA